MFLIETEEECVDMARDILKEAVRQVDGPDILIFNSTVLNSLGIDIKDLIKDTEEILNIELCLEDDDLPKNFEEYKNILLNHFFQDSLEQSQVS